MNEGKFLMGILTFWALLLAVLFGLFSCSLLLVLYKVVNRLAEVNKQLLIVVAGKDEKPEALRALVASAKPPQGKLRGIANEKKKDKESDNTDFTLNVGVR